MARTMIRTFIHVLVYTMEGLLCSDNLRTSTYTNVRITYILAVGHLPSRASIKLSFRTTIYKVGRVLGTYILLFRDVILNSANAFSLYQRKLKKFYSKLVCL